MLALLASAAFIPSPVAQAWKTCLDENTARYAPMIEPAEAVARVISKSCEEQANAVIAEAVADVRAKNPGPWHEVQERAEEIMRPSMADAVLKKVMDYRLAHPRR